MDINELEFAALVNLERIVRAAMEFPDLGPAIVGSLSALDQIRLDIQATKQAGTIETAPSPIIIAH